MTHALPATISDKQSIFNKARKDRFILVLTLPAILRDKNTPLLTKRAQELIQLESLQFAIWGSPVPDIIIPSQDLTIYGQPYKVTSQARQSYAPISINFAVDNRFNNFWVLWRWLEILNDPLLSGMPEHFAEYQAKKGKNNKPNKNKLSEKYQGMSNLEFQQISMKNNFLDYQTIMTVYGLDEYHRKVIQFNYLNAFITQLGGITYNYRDPTEIESSFQFVFNQLEVTLLDPVDSVQVQTA